MVWFRSLTVLAAATVAVPASAKAPDAGRVMIVLDASGSMAEKIGGVAKMDIAKKALADLLQGWDPAVEVGLTAYGHTRKGDCADIETIVPVGKFDKAKLLAASERLKPLGKTPISDATMAAAEALSYGEDKATVILISDGEETCGKDPCEAAKAMKAKGVDFRAHVVGFDVGGKDSLPSRQLRCLAEGTGGKYFSAKDAGELKEALASVAKATLSTEPVEAKPTPEPTPAETPKPVKSAATGLTLKALYATGGDPIESDLTWQVFADKGEDPMSGKVLSTDYAAEPKIELPPGKYRVKVACGLASTSRPFEVTPDGGMVAATIAMEAGVVKAVAKPSADGDPLAADLTWTVRLDAGDEEANNLTTVYDAQPTFVLNAGSYKVRAKFGEATAEATAKVTAGGRTPLEVIVGAGVAKPKAVFAEGGDEPASITWTLYEEKENLAGERKRITTVYDQRPVLRLQAGKYLLEAKAGDAAKRVELVVEANGLAEPVVNLSAGVVKPKAPEGTPADGRTWEVYTAKGGITGERKRVTTVYDTEPTLILSAGKYLLKLKATGVESEKEIEVKAGEKLEPQMTAGDGKVKE